MIAIVSRTLAKVECEICQANRRDRQLKTLVHSVCTRTAFPKIFFSAGPRTDGQNDRGASDENNTVKNNNHFFALPV